MKAFFDSIINLLDSNFFQSLVTGVAIIAAVLLGKKQNSINNAIRKMNDVVELYVTADVLKILNVPQADKPILKIQNVGTRLIYLDKYISNGSVYEVNGQVIPSTYSNAEHACYHVNLPTNGTAHVSLEIFYKDVEGFKWKTVVIAEAVNGMWLVKHRPKEEVNY